MWSYLSIYPPPSGSGRYAVGTGRYAVGIIAFCTCISSKNVIIALFYLCRAHLSIYPPPSGTGRYAVVHLSIYPPPSGTGRYAVGIIAFCTCGIVSGMTDNLSDCSSLLSGLRVPKILDGKTVPLTPRATLSRDGRVGGSTPRHSDKSRSSSFDRSSKLMKMAPFYATVCLAARLIRR
ncbi:hypothetical protein HNY73_021710 [Argiope bruennichi]|uniref:Uncharacterized protein n=1 Tax=Argiope bruennichi TaxID=94029 RepID=A0A8T0DYF7_ARGBR|nr:hypothetical protein HNY73_021710 [Argiope bruennichi]